MASAVERRMDLRRLQPEAYRALAAAERALATSTLEPGLRELVKLRASQLNGCAYCLRTHMEAARKLDVPAAKLDLLAAWSEAAAYDPRERAALAVAEAMTRADGPATDAAVDAAGAVMDESEVSALVVTIALMNAWNRLHAAAHTPIP